MTTVVETAAAFLEADGWPCERLADGSTLRTGAGQGARRWLCYVVAGEEDLVFYSLCPFSAPQSTRPAAAELLTRANYGLTIGAFEMDLDDGEIRFRTSLCGPPAEMTDTLLRPVFYGNALAMGRYLPAIEAVCLHGVDPEAAVAAAEALDADA